jgi:hypothetical protein
MEDQVMMGHQADLVPKDPGDRQALQDLMETQGHQEGMERMAFQEPRVLRVNLAKMGLKDHPEFKVYPVHRDHLVLQDLEVGSVTKDLKGVRDYQVKLDHQARMESMAPLGLWDHQDWMGPLEFKVPWGLLDPKVYRVRQELQDLED